MSSCHATQGPRVVRRYTAETEPCTRALKLLLTKAVVGGSGGDDTLSNAYRFPTESCSTSDGREGGPHDLTNKTTTEHFGKRTMEQREMEQTQHGETNGSGI
jgi:hypothetical protein